VGTGDAEPTRFPEVALLYGSLGCQRSPHHRGLCFAASISLTLAGHPEPAKILGMYPPTLVACAVFALVAEPKQL